MGYEVLWRIGIRNAKGDGVPFFEVESISPKAGVKISPEGFSYTSYRYERLDMAALLFHSHHVPADVVSNILRAALI